MNTKRPFRYAVLPALLFLSAMALKAGDFQPVAIVKVPFAFAAVEQQLPAGDYSVWRVTDSWGGPLTIRNRHDGKAVMISGHPMSGNKKGAPPKLVFHRYGDRFFLAEVWSNGTTGFDLPPSQQEREYVDSEVRYDKVNISGRSAR